MSISSAIVARGLRHYQVARCEDLLVEASRVGCSSIASQTPVELCPDYRAFPDEWLDAARESPIPRPYSFAAQEWKRLQVWISSDQAFSWDRAEAVLKPLQQCDHRVVFEVSGNRDNVILSFMVHRDDLAKVRLAFESILPHCRLAPVSFEDAVFGLRVALIEYVPKGSYDGCLTNYEEFGAQPLATLITGLSRLPSDYTAVYQCIFQGVPADECGGWRRNIENIRDLRYLTGLHRNGLSVSRQLPQTPSVDLRLNAVNMEAKVHPDRPLFCVVPRLAVFGDAIGLEKIAEVLSGFIGHFQHGGQPLNMLSSRTLFPTGDDAFLANMMEFGLTHREGFLVNSRELAGLVHCLSTRELEDRQTPIELLDPLALHLSLKTEGTRIGVCRQPGQEATVRIPQTVRERGTHVISSAGMGKSTLLIEMFLQDIESGGAVYIDPHGDAIHDILERIPPAHAERVIYLDTGDPDWIPLWNPIQPSSDIDRYRLADDLLSSLERVSKDWGDRLATILRNGLIGLMSLPEASLLDLFNLTRQKSRESDALRNSILEYCQDVTVRNFWEHDFVKSYRENDLASTRHKLQKLVSGGLFSRMFAQSESRIDFRRCMDQRMIILVDLSSTGAEAKSILGSFMVTLLMMAAVSRSNIPREARQSFSIFADEAHLFVSGDAFENLMTQARKFRVNLVIAHQYLKQFRSSQIDALSTAGSTIIGRVDKNDAHFFAKDLQDKVEAKAISMLPPYQMIGRIGTEVTRFFTLPPREPSGIDPADIIERSHERYYRHISKFTAKTKRRDEPKMSVLLKEQPVDPKLLEFDEF